MPYFNHHCKATTLGGTILVFFRKIYGAIWGILRFLGLARVKF